MWTVMLLRVLLLIWSGAQYLVTAASLESPASHELKESLQKLERIAEKLQKLEVSYLFPLVQTVCRPKVGFHFR